MRRERPLRPLQFLRGSRPKRWASIDLKTCYELWVDSSISPAIEPLLMSCDRAAKRVFLETTCEVNHESA